MMAVQLKSHTICQFDKKTLQSKSKILSEKLWTSRKWRDREVAGMGRWRHRKVRVYFDLKPISPFVNEGCS